MLKYIKNIFKVKRLANCVYNNIETNLDKDEIFNYFIVYYNSGSGAVGSGYDEYKTFWKEEKIE